CRRGGCVAAAPPRRFLERYAPTFVDKEASSMGKRELSGRIAVVTGAGRRRGIGTAICRALADKGADIFFVWHPHDRRMREEGDGPAELEAERSEEHTSELQSRE